MIAILYIRIQKGESNGVVGTVLKNIFSTVVLQSLPTILFKSMSSSPRVYEIDKSRINNKRSMKRYRNQYADYKSDESYSTELKGSL